MNRLFIITKYFAKDALGEMYGGSKIKTGITFFLSLLLIAFVSLPLIIIVDSLYEPLAMYGQEGLLFSIILLIGTIITFFLGIFLIMNVYYFSNDIEHFLPMPFKSSELVIGKFLSVYINLVIYSLIIVLPLLTIAHYGNFGVAYYIFIPIAVLVCPIMPMIVASLICMTLMRFTSLSKHKDMFRTVCGSLSLILIVVFNIFSQRMGNVMGGTDLGALVIDNNSIISTMSGLFITNKFVALGLINSTETLGIMNIIIAIIISIALGIVYYYVGGKLYLKGIIGISESNSKRENLIENGEISRSSLKSSPIKALVLRDIKVLFRTPSFFINSIMMMLYIPMMMVIMLFVDNGIGIAGMLSDTRYSGVVIAGVMFLTLLSLTSAGGGRMCLSREGKDFMFSKIIPIEYKDQALAKIISSSIVNFAMPILMVVALLFLKVNIGVIILCVITSVAASIFGGLMQILMDFVEPKLQWEDEKSMYKGDFKAFFVVILEMLIGGLLMALSFYIGSALLVFLVLNGFIVVFSYFIYIKIMNIADETYSNN